MRTKIKLTPLVVLILLLFSLLILQSCSLADRADPLEPTLTALNAAMAQTLTAVKSEDSVIHSLATAETVATAESQVIIATQTAEVVAQEQNSTGNRRVSPGQSWPNCRDMAWIRPMGRSAGSTIRSVCN